MPQGKGTYGTKKGRPPKKKQSWLNLVFMQTSTPSASGLPPVVEKRCAKLAAREHPLLKILNSLQGLLRKSKPYLLIMKSIIATGILLTAGTSAMAGPYANVESNSGYTGNDFDGSVIEIHKGYEGDLGEKGSWFVQAGPAIVAEDNEDTTTEFSGKVGASFDVSEAVEVYGEYSFITGDKFGSGVKAGATYRF